MNLDIEKILAMFKDLNIAWVGIIAVAIYLLWQNRENIPILKNFGMTSTSTEPTSTIRSRAFAQLDELYRFFQAENCPEGMAAIKTAGQHLFHDAHSPNLLSQTLQTQVVRPATPPPLDMGTQTIR